MHEVWMGNKIKYEDKASSSVAGRGANHVGEHRPKKQDHPNPQKEALLWPAARGVEAQGSHTPEPYTRPLNPHSLPITKGPITKKGKALWGSRDECPLS